MTVIANSRRREYDGNGATTIFNGPSAYRSSDLHAFLFDVATSVSTPISPSDYTVARLGREDGTRVTLVTPPAVGKKLVLLRVVPYDQEVDITNQGAFLPEVIEKGYDQLAFQTQQLADGISRSLRLPESSPVTGISTELPFPQGLAPLTWSADGTRLENGSIALTGDMLLRPNLASDAPGAGADLVSFRQSGIGSKGRTVLEKLRDFVSIKDFGAIGNGVANDSPAVSAAIAEAIASGRILRVQAGTYRLESPIVATLQTGSLVIEGEGRFNTKFVPDFSSPVAVFRFGLDGAYTANELHISGISIENAGNAADGIQCIDVGHIAITRCYINGGSRGIYCLRGFGANIFDNMITSTTASAIVMEEKAINAGRVSHNDIFACGNAKSEAAIIISQGDHAEIVGNDIEGCYGGIIFAGVSSGLCHSNYIEAGDYPVYFSGGSKNVDVRGNWFGDAVKGMLVENCSQITITHNAFYNCSLVVVGATVSSIDVGSNTALGTSVLAKSPWQAPALINSWANAEAPFAPAGYRKDNNGRVWLRGLLLVGTADTVAFQLPAGFRPAFNSDFPTISGNNNAAGRVRVFRGGNVNITQGTGGSFVTLDGISFMAEL